LPGDRIRIVGTDVIVNDQVIPEHRIEANEERREKAPLKIITASERKPEDRYDVYHKPFFDS
jgi:hypothetical protein